MNSPILRSRYTKEKQMLLDNYKQEWEKLSKAKKDEINDEFMRYYGDHTKMYMVNKKPKDVSISFIDHSIIGMTENTEIVNLDKSLLDIKDQSTYWMIQNKKHQKKLKLLGFY